MNNEEALKIIKALADGIDPLTGEILPVSSPYQSAQVVRALHASVKALEHKTKSDARRTNLPTNAGKSWSVEEDRLVCSAFDEGKTVTEIAKTHQRTRGAIQSRLVKLGKIEVTPEFETKVELIPQKNEVIPPEDADTYISEALHTGHECIDCGAEIPAARLKAVPGVSRCATCQEKLEKRDPATFQRKVDEGLPGSREDHKRMQGKQFSDMRRRNYE